MRVSERIGSAMPCAPLLASIVERRNSWLLN
jgi:hypothetical protein